MPNQLTVVVAGFEELSQELAGTGRFAKIIPIQATSGLRAATRVDLKGLARDTVAFFFTDNLTVDTPQDLSFLLGKLVGMGYKVVVCDVAGSGRDIVAATPGAGIIAGPFHLNKALGALAALGFGGMDPTDDGFTNLDPFAARASGSQSTSDVPSSGWGAPSPVVSPGGWGQPSGPPSENPNPQTFSAPTGQPGGAPVRRGGLAARNPSAGANPVGPTTAQAGFGVPFGGGPAPRAGAVRAGMGNLRRATVISISAPKGGVGKSSMTLNTAAVLARVIKDSGRTVCVIDANFQNGDTGKYLNRYDPTIKDLLEQAGSLTPEVVGRFLITHNTYRFSALLAPPTPIDGNPTLVNGKMYTKILDVLREMFDYIIVDTPVAELHHDIFDNFILPQSDYLIMAAAPNEPTLLNINLYLQSICAPRHAGGRGFDEQKVGVFLNRAEEDIGCDVETARNALSAWQWLGHLPESKEWKLANNQGRLVVNKNLVSINKRLISMLAVVTNDPDVIAADQAGQVAATKKGGLFSKLLARSGS